MPAGPSWELLETSRFCAAASASPVPTITPTSVVNQKNGYLIPIPTEPSLHAAARMSCYLAEAVPRLLPSVTCHRLNDAEPFEAYVGRSFDPNRPEETAPPFFTAEALVRDERGTGEVSFGMSPRYEDDDSARAGCSGPPCTVRTGPHGELVTVLDSTMASGVRLVNVSVYKKDTITTASAMNGVLAATPADPGRAYSDSDYRRTRDDLPITVDQLIAVAAAPEMDLFP
ncbi:hypothetical protein [Paractinoplanes deccanensis]|uniref:hypothetical protein n=1 Tax=Paractinoplanes deccanensis TaxID=113561 RepID=UPI0019407FE9|nr:hypothetical protein [Actinoplanes deccanensis]